MNYEKANKSTTSSSKLHSTFSHSQRMQRLMEENEYEEDYDNNEAEDELDGIPKDDQQSELYIVERIIKKRVYQGKVQYFVKWLDYSSKSNTWEPLANLSTIPNMIYQFEYGLPQTGVITQENEEIEEGEEGEEIEKYQPSSEDIERIIGHDTINGKLKYLVSYKNWHEIGWVSRLELPKKKLNEYNEYLKDGGMSNSNYIQPIQPQTVNKNNTTVTATRMEEEEEQQQPQQEDEQDPEMEVKLEENSNEIDTTTFKDKDSILGTPSKPSIPTIWQTSSNNKSNTKSIMKSSSRIDEKGTIAPGLSQLDKILEPIPLRKAILKKNKPSQRKCVTFSEVEEDLCKDTRKTQLTKKQTPLKRIGQSTKEVKLFKDLISSPATPDNNKIVEKINNSNKQTRIPQEQSSISTPSVNSTNAFKTMSSIRATAFKKDIKNSTVNNDKTKDIKEIDKKDSQFESKSLQSSMKGSTTTITTTTPATSITAVGQPVKHSHKEDVVTSSKGKVIDQTKSTAATQIKDTKEPNITSKPLKSQIQQPQAAASSDQSMPQLEQSQPAIVAKQEKIQNYQQQQYQAAMIQQQYQQAQYAQQSQVQQQQQQLPQQFELKKEKTFELEGSFEQGDCEHKVTIRSLERELEDMIFEVFWKPRADGTCPRSKLVKYSDLKKHAPYKLIYWLEVMVRNSVQELEANEFKYNQLVSQQQQQQQQYHSQIHNGAYHQQMM